ncbi:MAG: tmRNA-binding protein SmpB [Candidatus Rifleibacterium amylolyticum]|nr:MAG: tmRNA-binding protein SmpB [Candidatus Rifleibacterium amylolyticum]NLF95915.1 SsrA-binding protein SmpB [Candidatus Riflebacteria bacterium]
MSSKKQQGDGLKIIAANRKAHHDYFIVEKLEAGIVLLGSELRPCREGRVTLKDSYAEEIEGQLWLQDMHIGSNPFSNRLDHEPERKRRLLAHKSEIIKWGYKVRTSGMTIVPLKVYFKNGKVKVELGLAKGKAKYDKREALQKKDAKRDMERELGGRY